MLKNNHFEPLLVIYIPVWGLLIAIAHERVLSSPPDDCRSIPNLRSIGWVLLWSNSPKSNNALRLCQIPLLQCACFPPLLKQRTQVFETTEGLVSVWWSEDISPQYLKKEPKKPQRKKCLCACMHIYSIHVLKHTNTLMCLLCRCALTVASLHGCMCVYIHSDNWLKPCSANGIVMTSARVTRSDAIGSSITWNSTWLLVLKWPACLPTCQRMATGQSHFQQINLIWKFSSPCNLKQQQQGSDSLPILNSFFFSLSLPLSLPRKKSYWMRGGREGQRDGWVWEEKEGGKEGWQEEGW